MFHRGDKKDEKRSQLLIAESWLAIRAASRRALAWITEKIIFSLNDSMKEMSRFGCTVTHQIVYRTLSFHFSVRRSAVPRVIQFIMPLVLSFYGDIKKTVRHKFMMSLLEVQYGR